MMKQLKSRKINFWVEPERFDRFLKACNADKRDLSDVFRLLMDEYSEKIEKEVKTKIKG